MSENQLIGIIYLQLIEEFGFGYSEKDLWMLAENIAGKIVNQIPQLNDNQQIVLEWLKGASEKNVIKMNPIATIYTLHRSYSTNDTADVFDAYEEMSFAEEAQILAVFAQWVLEQEGV